MARTKAQNQRRGFSPPTVEDPPLLRVLIAEATRRGDTLSTMARHLGVTYRHVAQWRRREADVSKASRAVFEAAAAYLDVPTAYVLCMAGLVKATDFTYRGGLSLQEALSR